MHYTKENCNLKFAFQPVRQITGLHVYTHTFSGITFSHLEVSGEVLSGDAVSADELCPTYRKLFTNESCQLSNLVIHFQVLETLLNMPVLISRFRIFKISHK